MAASKKILTLNLGSQTISAAQFAASSGGGLRLLRVEIRELLADPAADATRISQGALAIAEIADGLKARKQTVRCALAAQSSFSRLVKIPAFSTDDFSQAVAFEAQQNIPYPLNEVSWDYKKVRDSAENEPEVLIVAAKNEILEDWVGALAEAKMSASGIEMAPLALYNAFRYNYGEPQGCSLLIDLGARTTNLIFIEPGKFYFRTISSGGNALSAAVAKEFGEPIMVAENRKCESGMVGRGSHFEEPEDPEVARLSKILRNSATRLHAEVARSISFYRSQQGGSAPNRVLLCGGGVFLPLTLEFWQEKLGLPVELFNPLRCIQVDPTQAQELAKLAPRLGELVGLALESVVECPLTLNLIPAAILRRKRLVQQSAAILMAAACVSASLGVWAATTHHATRQARALREELTPRLENLKSLSQKIKQAQEELSLVHKSAAPYEKAVSERDYWVRLIQYIHSCLPEKNIWVTNLEIKEPDLPKNVRGPLRPLPQNPAVKPAPAQSAAPVGAAGPGASSAFPGSATQGTPPSSQPVLLIKGLWLENPSQSRVVQDFGFKLKADSSFFTVPESDKWEIIDKATPTEWAQTFSIPLQLTVAPEKSLQLAP